MSIANRLVAGFAFIIVLLAGLGLYGVSQLGLVRDTTDTIVSRDLAMIRDISVISDGQSQMRAYGESGVRDALAARNAQKLEETEEAWRKAYALTNDTLTHANMLADQFTNQALSEDRAQAWRQIGELLDQVSGELEALRGDTQQQSVLLRAGNVQGALALEDSLDRHRAEFSRLLAATRTAADQSVAAGRERVRVVYEESRLSTLIAIALAIAVGIGVSLLLRNSIVGPLQRFMTFVERVGRGDLAGDPAMIGSDEVGRLGVTLNKMVEGLKDIASQSRDVTANLNAAITEIRASSQEQAAGVEEQLAAVQETAATVDEIAHSGAQVSKRAQEVIATAQATAHTSADGLRAVEDTTRVMDSIREQAEMVAQNIVALSEKTQAIGDIISTVNDISERSHLLALNAAIEAAAAGESGRSFAVVASEMKVLADQAKDATNQVRAILSDVQRGINTSVMLTEEAVKRVSAGKDRSDTTQRVIGEITSRVQEGALTFQQIVASTNQQQLGIEQVMGALQNIRQASQQTAAGTRQLNEAAGNLSGLSQQLLTLADRYKV